MFSFYVLIGFIFEINDFTFAAYFGLFIYFVLISINYFIFIKDDKYKNILNIFIKESTIKKRISRTILIAVIFFIILRKSYVNYSLFKGMLDSLCTRKS